MRTHCKMEKLLLLYLHCDIYFILLYLKYELKMRKFMDLHFEDIHIFTAVAETPNLLEATILLNMSVASVIKRLTEFEENLDIILFERRKKNLF